MKEEEEEERRVAKVVDEAPGVNQKWERRGWSEAVSESTRNDHRLGVHIAAEGYPARQSRKSAVDARSIPRKWVISRAEAHVCCEEFRARGANKGKIEYLRCRDGGAW